MSEQTGSVRLETPNIPVSWGELVDKITILEIKAERIAHPDALKNVRYELALLQAVIDPVLAAVNGIVQLKAQLKSVNERLWRIEDRIREKEALAEFDTEFIALARSVYRTNDDRSAIKTTINERLGSRIREEKSYHAYRADGPR